MGHKPQGAQYKRSWKNYLLNARYQLRFTLFMVVLAAVLMSALGFYVMRTARDATRIGIDQLKGDAAMFIEAREEKIAHLEDRQTMIGVVLIGMGVALSVGLFIYGILMTHKVAGPLYKIGLYLDKVKSGKYDKVWPLRKGDQLVAFFEHFKEAHGALRQVQERDVAQLKELLAAVEKHETLSKSPVVAEMRQLLASKEAGLV